MPPAPQGICRRSVDERGRPGVELVCGGGASGRREELRLGACCRAVQISCPDKSLQSRQIQI